MAEQFAFEQGLGQGGAVDGDHRAARVRRLMNGPATCSLPVPVSPSMRIVVVVWATLLIISKTARMRGLLLMMLQNE